MSFESRMKGLSHDISLKPIQWLFISLILSYKRKKNLNTLEYKVPPHVRNNKDSELKSDQQAQFCSQKSIKHNLASIGDHRGCELVEHSRGICYR